MNGRKVFCASLFILQLALGTSAGAQTEGSAPSVKGSGTSAQIPKWLDERTIGESVVTELNGNIGVGTSVPASKLTVTGNAEADVAVRVSNTADQGSGLLAEGSGRGVGGEGVVAHGGSGVSLAGDGVLAGGGVGPTGGTGVVANGGNGSNGKVGVGVFARGGISGTGDGGVGVGGFGGVSFGAGHRGGDGLVGTGGLGLAKAAAGRAGFFVGDVEVTGTLTKGGGSFKIDHPLDPQNQYLFHSFVESPDMMNVYNGNITTDQNGVAVVELPAWFEALNKDFRYQLTVMGTFANAMVAEKIMSNHFTLKTSAPNVEVSWQVTGIRRDPWAESHRIAVEQAKPEGERGHYLYPELYGHPEKNTEMSRDTEFRRR